MAAMLSKPPAPRTPAQIHAASQRQPTAPIKGKSATNPKNQNSSPGYLGLNDPQNQMINQRTTGDLALGQAGNNQLSAIQNSYSQPMDWSKGPQAPVTGDYNTWANSQMQNYNNAYDQRMNPINKQQSDDFEQDMADKGIPIDSKTYNDQKQQMLQSQNDARTQAYASGQGQATQDAQTLFNVGTTANSNSITQMQQQRNQPLNDYMALYGATSPQMMQNLGYSQQLGGQNNQAQNQIKVNQQSPRSGGGGGGGTDPYMGMGSYQNLLDTQNASKLQLAYGMQQLQPQQQQPDYWASAAGSGLTGLGYGLLAGG